MRVNFNFDKWKSLGHPHCFIGDGKEIVIKDIRILGGQVDAIFYRLVEYDGYLYVSSEKTVFMNRDK